MEQTILDIDTLIKAYAAAWGEPDPVARRSLLEAVWNETGTYTDPMVHAANRVELDAVIARFLSDNPGASFSVSGKIDYHHGHVRFYWLLNFATGDAFPGMDYGEVAPNGKLVKIVGFF